MNSFPGQSHCFDIGVASKYGVEKAIIIHHFQHWIRINQFSQRNIREGRCWSYQTRKEIQAHFPYWSYEEVKYLTEKLIEEGVLITANFNKNPIDKTLWYAFVDEKAFGVDAESSRKLYERENSPSMGKIPRGGGKIPSPIPDTIPDTKTEDMLGAEAPPPPTPKVPPRKRIKEEFQELAPRVFLTISQQNALKTRLDASRISLEDVALHLSDWKIGKGITGGSSDYRAILDWVIEAVSKKKSTTSDKMPDRANPGSEAERVQRQADRAEQAGFDRMLITKIQRRFVDQFKIELIRSHGDFLEFNLGDRGGVIKCQAGEPGFKEKCLKYLRSLNLDTSGL